MNNGKGGFTNMGEKTWWPDNWSDQKVWDIIEDASQGKNYTTVHGNGCDCNYLGISHL